MPHQIIRTVVSSLFCFFLFVSWSSKGREAPTDIENRFDRIDLIVHEAIQQRQFPGCQVLVLQRGEKIFERSYGYLTYDSLAEVTAETIYDLASVTKVAATTLMIMHLYENRLLRLDDPISCYLKEYVGSNKADITIRQLLSHNGEIRPYVPFWEQTLGGDFLDPKCNEVLPIDQYGHISNAVMLDSMKSWIVNSRLSPFRGKSQYRYSDLGFMILHMIAEEIAQQPMETYLLENFYQPLGLNHTYFNPVMKGVPFTNIAPTEYDLLYRFTQIWGSVHDRNAAIFGGVAGHSGLFANSEDLGKLMTLFLNNGLIDGHQLLNTTTVEEFNQSYFNHNRRGLGWDKKNEQVSQFVSPASFGHTGFTGTMVWADPKHDLVFVFLSNRVYPDAENRKLITHQTRSKIQDVVYEAISESKSSITSEVE